MKEKIEEWSKFFGYELIEVRNSEKVIIVVVRSNIILIPELKTLGYITGCVVTGVEMTKYNKLKIWMLNNE